MLRVVLGQVGALPQWADIELGVTSALTEVECLRTLDRLQHQGRLAAAEAAVRRELVYRLLERLEVAEPSRGVLERAAAAIRGPELEER